MYGTILDSEADPKGAELRREYTRIVMASNGYMLQKRGTTVLCADSRLRRPRALSHP